jgi:DNA-binding transcriptional MerR regulator
MSHQKIGVLAKRTGCDIETIRYYEREGLIELPQRLPSGYRVYEARHEQQLEFVLHCRSLGMSLADIKMILAFKHQPELGCAEINTLLDAQILLTKARLKTLRRLETQLSRLRAACTESRSAQACGILSALTAASQGRPCECHV